MLDLSEEVRGRCLVISLLSERLDHAVASQFREHVLRRAADYRGTIVLDLSRVEFMDSSGLGAVVGIRKRLGWNVRVVLAGLKSPVYRAFELARMTHVFSFYTSADAAVNRAHA